MNKFLKVIVTVCVSALVCVSPVFGETKKNAYPSMIELKVGEKDFTVGAYNINGYNYFKLRDAAMLLKDTEKSFSVGYDTEEKKILINTSENYTPDGGEFKELISFDAVSALETNVKISCDGKDIEGLSMYNIEGYNYFKFRDIAAFANVGIDFDEAERKIIVSPDSGYMDIKETKFPLYDLGCFHMDKDYCGIYFSEGEGWNSIIENVEFIGATVSINNSEMKAQPFRDVPEEEIAKVAESLKVNAVYGVYVDYPFELGSHIEVRIYAKLTDDAGNEETHCYILSGDIDHYWDMYPNN